MGYCYMAASCHSFCSLCCMEFRWGAFGLWVNGWHNLLSLMLPVPNFYTTWKATPVRSLVYSSVDTRVLFTASDDSHVHMYDAEGKSLFGAMSSHASWVLSVDTSPDGSALATGSSDRTV